MNLNAPAGKKNNQPNILKNFMAIIMYRTKEIEK